MDGELDVRGVTLHVGHAKLGEATGPEPNPDGGAELAAIVDDNGLEAGDREGITTGPDDITDAAKPVDGGITLAVSSDDEITSPVTQRRDTPVPAKADWLLLVSRGIKLAADSQMIKRNIQNYKLGRTEKEKCTV